MFTIRWDEVDARGPYSNIRYYGINGYTPDNPKQSTLGEVLMILQRAQTPLGPAAFEEAANAIGSFYTCGPNNEAIRHATKEMSVPLLL
jgi:hypothetical protein